MSPPLGAEVAICDCSAPSNRDGVYREYAFGERPQPPSNNEKSPRKVSPMTTVRRPPWVKWRPSSPCPPPRDCLNTLPAES